MIWQDRQCRNKGDNRAKGSTFPDCRSTPLTFWPYLPIFRLIEHGLTSVNRFNANFPGIHQLRKQYTYPFTGTPLATDWKCPPGHLWRTWLQQMEEHMDQPHHCLSICNPGPLVVEIATTLSRSSAAVSEWVCNIKDYLLSWLETWTRLFYF